MNKTNRRSFVVGSAALAAGIPMLSHIASAEDATPAATPAGAASLDVSTQVRFANLDPSLAKVEIAINGKTVEEEFKYGTSSEWHDVDPGGVRVTISADRTGINYWVYDATTPMAAGNHYQMLISPVVVFTTLVDQSPISAGHGRIGFIQASVNTPAVDVTKDDGTVVLSNIKYGYVSSYVEIPEGEYTFQIRPTGSSDVALSTNNLQVVAGTVYDFALYGDPSDTDHPLSLLLLTTKAQSS